MPLDYDKAKRLIEGVFVKAEVSVIQGSPPSIATSARSQIDTVFQSRTQAYREVLLGCIVARIQDIGINIRQPYVDQGPNTFSGRGLDERVINPFLQEKRIPCSRGPYLSVFRRSVRFDESTREGLRDKAGYDAFLAAIEHVESFEQDSELLDVLLYLLYKFAELRESASVPLSRLQRISLQQYDDLVSGLLDTPSGGRFPVLLAVAAFTTIQQHFHLDWEVRWQGINVADAATGAGGDISIVSGGRTLMAAEVTERPVDRSRVVTTFNAKIAPATLEDYMFLIGSREPTAEAREQAQRYFPQGHDVNFVEIKKWIFMLLATVGSSGRSTFNKSLIGLLDGPDIPRGLKVAWNDQISRITG